MTDKSKTKEYLLQFATSQELSNSINYAFQTSVTSNKFSELDEEDRELLMFHWQMLQDFFTDVPAKNISATFGDN
jgi:hypothetical protein